MRTIKFRAWDKRTKQIFEVKQIDFTAIERNVYGYITTNSLFGKSDTELQWRSFDDIELMQFTGLKDKKEVEIYEGDIVSHPNEFLDGGEIKFIEGLFVIYKDGRDDLLCYHLDAIEIIGNIYENKERLDDK